MADLGHYKMNKDGKCLFRLISFFRHFGNQENTYENLNYKVSLETENKFNFLTGKKLQQKDNGLKNN